VRRMPAHHPSMGMAMGVEADETGRAALALAREAVERYVRTGLLVEPTLDLSWELRQASAAFVTLRARGRLRGCVGTVAPSRPDLAREIVASAVAAATLDFRFLPVRPDELPSLTYEVAIVDSLEAARGPEDLDPKTYGVVVEADGRRGVLLPDLDGVDRVEQQLAIAREKAELPDNAAVTLHRFRVRRHVER